MATRSEGMAGTQREARLASDGKVPSSRATAFVSQLVHSYEGWGGQRGHCTQRNSWNESHSEKGLMNLRQLWSPAQDWVHQHFILEEGRAREVSPPQEL